MANEPPYDVIDDDDTRAVTSITPAVFDDDDNVQIVPSSQPTAAESTFEAADNADDNAATASEIETATAVTPTPTSTLQSPSSNKRTNNNDNNNDNKPTNIDAKSSTTTTATTTTTASVAVVAESDEMKAARRALAFLEARVRALDDSADLLAEYVSREELVLSSFR